MPRPPWPTPRPRWPTTPTPGRPTPSSTPTTSLATARDALATEALEGASRVALDGTVASVDLTVGEELAAAARAAPPTGSATGSGSRPDARVGVQGQGPGGVGAGGVGQDAPSGS